MICKFCGYELNEKWIICPKCSNSVNHNDKTSECIPKAEVINNEENHHSSENISNLFGIRKDRLCIIIFTISIVLGFIIIQIRGICFLAALMSIVTGFIKYPQNRAIKILFWLFIAGIIIYIISIILVLFMCASLLNSCGYSCY